MKSFSFKQTGSMLIEALVALVIVGVGTLGVVKLNSVMLNGTGLSKTRAEALEIALKRMEDLRNYALNVGCPSAGSTTETDPVTGVNASYVVGRSITDVTAEQMDVEVCVAWDGSNAPCGATADKRIILKSTVSCLGVGTSGMLAGNATTETGGKLKTPTGAAKVGGGDYGNNKPTGRTINYLGGDTSGTADGTSTYLNAQGAYELIDEATGRVLLTVDDGSAFSTISGRVYIETNNSGNPIVNPGGSDASTINDDNVFVLSSDASYCARIIPATLPVIPANASGSSIKYRYFDYQCYVSKGWWGNIGIARLDSPNVNNRVCVGDPGVSQSETSIWSRKTALSVSRGYRAYRETDTGVYETTGIGVSTSDGIEYAPVKIPSAANASTEHHDFLITVITGNGSCQDSNKMNLTDPSTFTGNQGKFYCMSGQCPGLTQTDPTPHTLIHGTITKNTGATIAGFNDSDCSSKTFTDNVTSYSYSCKLNWTGFAGANWKGSISFQTTGTNTLCATGSPPVVVPSGSVAYTVNNRFAATFPNSLTFTDVPVGVTDVTIDFDVKAAFCGALGQPFPSWSNGALIWPAIPGGSPTQYKVYTCTVATATSTSCVPDALVRTDTSLSYTPSVKNSDTSCISIIAHDGSGAIADSPPSSPKCVSRTNGNRYTYN